jgi:hypothetical protein
VKNWSGAGTSDRGLPQNEHAGPGITCRKGRRLEARAMTDRSHEALQDVDLRNLTRVISVCTLGLWAFAVGLLIGTFLFS